MFSIRYKLVLFSLSFLLASPATSADGPPEPAAEAEFDDPILPLTPKRAPSEAELDRRHAATLYAHAQMLLSRRDLEGALRRFQRAWRYQPERVPIMETIFPLALQLDRDGEASRYAMIAAEREPMDPKLLRQLAELRSRQQDWEPAASLLQKVVDARPDEKSGSELVILRTELGRLRFLTGDFPRAADCFAYVYDALQHPDRHGLDDATRAKLLEKGDHTYTLFAECYLLADRPDDAEALFRKSHEAKPDAATLAWGLARVEKARGNDGKALEQLNQFLVSDSAAEGTEPYKLFEELLRSTAESEQQAQEQLLERLEDLHKANPMNQPLASFFAEKLRSAGRLDQAEKLYRQLLQSQTPADSLQGLADIYVREKRADGLLEILGKAATQDGSLNSLGELLDKLAADQPLVSRLTETVRQRLQGDPPSAGEGVALAMALLAVQTRQFDAADELFEAAVKASTTPAETMTSWAETLLQASEFERAAKTLRRMLEDDVAPENRSATYFYLAGALELSGKTDEAVEAARQLAKLSPESARLQSRLPWILYHAKRYAEAEKSYLDLLERFDSNHRSAEVRDVLTDARLILSNICVKEERMAEAEEWLEQVLDEFPDNVGAQNDLGYLWCDQGKNLNRSLVMIQKAVEAEPKNIAYLDSLGWVHFRLGQFDEAIRELEKAVSLDDEPDGVILDHLGDAYQAAGEPEKALETWRKAVEAMQKSGDTEQLEKTRAKIKCRQPDG